MAYVPPVGQTTDPDIFMENVKRADQLISGPAGTVPDRGGEPLDTWREMMAKNDEVRQNIIPLSRQYMTLAAAQADIANIPVGSTTYYRSPDDNALAIEVINNGGTLEATGRKMPSQQSVNDAYDKASSVAELIQSNETEVSLHDFCDEEGFVGAQVQMGDDGVGIKSKSVELLPKSLQNLLFSLLESSADGFKIHDEDGHILASFIGGVAEFFGVTLTYDWQQSAVDMFSRTFGMSADSFTLNLDDGDDIITLSDPDGFVFLRLTSDFQLLTKITGGGSGSDGTDIVSRLNSNSAAVIVASSRKRYYLTQQPTADINIYIVCGQSFSVGTWSVVALSTVNQFGNKMLGNSPRGMNYHSANTSDVFGPLGGSNVLVDLVEVTQDLDGVLSTPQIYGETVLSGWLNFGKFLHNQRLMTDNDTSRTFTGACCGVGGKSIAQLSKGATPNYYNHVITALQGMKDAADAQGKTSRFCGIMWMQGENDGSTAYSTYYSALETLRTNIITDGSAIFGQSLPPHWYNYQLGGSYASDSNSLAVSRALLDFCDNNPGTVSFVNPVGQLPNPMSSSTVDNHLFANSYRWYGCDAGKVMDIVQRGAGRTVFRMREAAYKGGVVTIGLTPPVPPLRVIPAYVGSTATTYTDMGFTVRDGLGDLYGSDLTVEIVADCVIQITASRDLVAPVAIWLGDKTYHAGVHNIADSDDSLANYSWDLVTDSPASESIAALNGKPYALRNWCGSDIITAEEY
ncbi:sialate O-acetylesterase [Klebsiella michiganensis]|uniref:sialate O-acetylesterase n=1 Tax=Klebsiella michiganensis TaxID=1134687 RepID=UPI001CCD91C4|nr:sialate O-acetylesterase [Klebsiella michiganensis]